MLRRVVLSISLFHLLLLGQTGAGDRSPPGPTTIKVLIVGNSYTKRFDVSLAGVVNSLTAKGPVKIVAEAHYISNSTLDGHLKVGIAKKIAKGGYDVVVLQDYSNRPITDFEKTQASLLQFAAVFKETKSRGILFLPWAPRKKPESLAELDAAFARLGKEFGMPVAPFGHAWKRALEKRADLGLYEKDGAHPTPAGMYLNACVLYARLTARSPEGLGDAGLNGMDEATCRLLQSVAWSMVSEREITERAKEETKR